MDPLRAMIIEIVREELANFRQTESPSESPKYLSTAEAARMAGVAPGTVRRWKDAGRLKPYGAGKDLRFAASEIAALMQSGPTVRGRNKLLQAQLSPEALAARELDRKAPVSRERRRVSQAIRSTVASMKR